MRSAIQGAGLATLMAALVAPAAASEVSGHYMEARTCQVYTGPCFANGEVGLTGQDAIMAWSIEEGQHEGVDLAGCKVVMVVRASDTLGFGGIDNAGPVRSVVMVDEKATAQQRKALVEFARLHSGKAGKSVVRVTPTEIAMTLDTENLDGRLKAGKHVELVTRKAKPEDCICSNESKYYPPLTKLENFSAGVTIKGGFSGRGLGTQWSIPDSRSSYMATFSY